MSALLLFACPALLAFAGLYHVADRPVRQTLRLAGATAMWTAFIVLIITRR